MRKALLMLLLLRCTICCIAQNDQPQQLYFNYLGVKNGLPEGQVNTLLQDKEGYVWIGTQNGLVRYDGYSAKKYELKAKGAGSINVFTLHQDNENRLWIGTDRGLYYYNRADDAVVQQEIFNPKYASENYRAVSINDNIDGKIWLTLYDIKTNSYSLGLLDIKTKYSIFFGGKEKGNQHLNAATFYRGFSDKKGIVWIGTEDGLLEYIPAAKMFKTHYFPGDTAHRKTAFAMHQDAVHPEFLWFTIKDEILNTSEGLGRYNTHTKALKVFHRSNNDPNSISSDTAAFALSDSKKRTWFFTANGLALYDPLRETFTNFVIKEKERSPGNGINNERAYEDKEGNLWCQTGEGLLYFNTHTGSFTRHTYNEKVSEGLLSNQVVKLMLDRQGLPWIGVAQLGLQWVNKQRSKFTLFKNDPGQLHDFPGGQVNSFAEAADGTFWLGSSHGLYHWQPLPDSFTLIPFDKNANKDVVVGAVTVDKGGSVWFGANDSQGAINGLYCYDPKTQKTKNYRYSENDSLSLSNNNVYTTFQDKSGVIWIGTDGGGLCSFNLGSQNFKRYPFIVGDKNQAAVPKGNSLDDSQVRSIYQDKQGVLWIGTNIGGLNKFDLQFGTFTSYKNKLPGFACVLSIHDDSKGNIWAGTYMGGLFALNKKTGSLKKYSEKNGLLYDGGWGIQEDKNSNLWIASPRGLSILNLQTNQVRNLTGASGLPQEPGPAYILYKTRKGMFLFGSKDGFIELNPEDFTPDATVPVIHIERVVFTKVSSKNGLKDSSIVAFGKSKINLHYDENRITFNYVGLLYQNTSLIQYAYTLNGYDKDWVQAGTQRTVTYTNLSPGTYTFRVKGANSDGVWSTKDDAITIIISPPWWRTWLAYVIYALLFAAALRTYIAFRSRSLRRNNRALEEMVGQRTHQLSEANEELKTTQEEILSQRDELAQTVNVLRSTQNQLIQSEKMASLGELTAGIAHEIQNPLNFVTNFSEVSNELIEEMNSELEKGDIEEAKLISNDIKENLEKINHHGKRADAIVKGMLQHSRNNSGERQWMDVNSLADEYLRLSYHGLRAKDKTFNANMVTYFQDNLPKINAVPQDIGRVLLNLFNNAFYAVQQKQKVSGTDYKPEVTVSTSFNDDFLAIKVKDNGSGIPAEIKDKILQPFFTTKPTGEGTGLGLSLSYDIVVKGHGGKIVIESENGQGSAFVVQLPIVD